VKISKEFKVGALAITSIVILYFGFNYLKGIDLFKKTNNYYALYDNIDGLTISNPVIINGLSVGRVSNIKILQNNENLVLVEVSIESELQLPIGTKARLINTDFLGSKAIELILDDSSIVSYVDGDTLKSEVDEGITEFLKQSAGPVADNIGTTISRINAILENFQGNSEKINVTLEHFQGISKTLDYKLPALTDSLTVMISNFNQTSKDLSEMLNGLKPILANTAQLTDSLKGLELSETLEKTQVMLDNLNTNLVSLKEGNGTMGKLMHDDSLYVYLSHTARDLDNLLVDLQANPGRYVQFSVFGKKDKSEKKKKKDKAD
jgi:phospholipid/cholesterol/gamma-HCH transport system substrate-binding protein